MRRGLLTTSAGSLFVSLSVLMVLVSAVPGHTAAQGLSGVNGGTALTRQQSASAAQSVPGNGTSKRGGVTISPAFQQISLTPDKPGISFEFEVTNNSTKEYEFALSVVDFGSLDETGGVLFVGNAEKALSYRYALSPWVTLGKDRVVVGPRSTEKVPITIVNKESLTPGGHYGAVLVTPTESSSGGDRKVQIDQVASSLLFVKKIGGEVYKLNLSSFKVRPHIFSLPKSMDMRFQNDGNVHVIPRGLVTIADPRGRVVSRGIINADSGIALPESFRSLKVPLETVGGSLMPGKYRMTAVYRYDDQTATRSVSSTFYYFNLLFVLLVLVLLVILALVVFSRSLRQSLVSLLSSTVRRALSIRLKKRRQP